MLQTNVECIDLCDMIDLWMKYSLLVLWQKYMLLITRRLGMSFQYLSQSPWFFFVFWMFDFEIVSKTGYSRTSSSRKSDCTRSFIILVQLSLTCKNHCRNTEEFSYCAWAVTYLKMCVCSQISQRKQIQTTQHGAFHIRCIHLPFLTFLFLISSLVSLSRPP